jgi:hypothetical protein
MPRPISAIELPCSFASASIASISGPGFHHHGTVCQIHLDEMRTIPLVIVETLVHEYSDRFFEEFCAIVPAPDKPTA